MGDKKNTTEEPEYLQICLAGKDRELLWQLATNQEKELGLLHQLLGLLREVVFELQEQISGPEEPSWDSDEPTSAGKNQTS